MRTSIAQSRQVAARILLASATTTPAPLLSRTAQSLLARLRASLKKNGRSPRRRLANKSSADVSGAIVLRFQDCQPATDRIRRDINPLPRCSSYPNRSMPSRAPNVLATCSIDLTLATGLARLTIRIRRSAGSDSAEISRGHDLQSFVHHEKLIIFFTRGLLRILRYR
jgi:hypothetical protein